MKRPLPVYLPKPNWYRIIPVMSRQVQMVDLARRTMDVAGAVAGLILFGPVMAAITLLVRLDSPGPVFFRQNRVGRHGRVFRLIKFRTVRTDCDPYGFSPNAADDPRVTRTGRFLRKTSLDELPQLFNVLQGEMTLVGPRPLLPWQYELWTPRQRRRCDVKPGLTGWAQIRGRGAVTHEDKIELDLWYIERRSLWLDLRIIAETVVKVFRRQDVFEVQYSRASSPPKAHPSDSTAGTT